MTYISDSVLYYLKIANAFQIELNPLPIKLNEEVVSKDKCFNSEINSVPKSQSIQCIR